MEEAPAAAVDENLFPLPDAPADLHDSPGKFMAENRVGGQIGVPPETVVGPADAAGIDAQDNLILGGYRFGKFLDPELPLGE